MALRSTRNNEENTKVWTECNEEILWSTEYNNTSTEYNEETPNIMKGAPNIME